MIDARELEVALRAARARARGGRRARARLLQHRQADRERAREHDATRGGGAPPASGRSADGAAGGGASLLERHAGAQADAMRARCRRSSCRCAIGRGGRDAVR